MRKCIAPTPEYCKASTEEEIQASKVFVNSIDDGFGDESADILAETCTTLASTLGKLIADSLVPLMLMEKEKVEVLSPEMLDKALDNMYKKHGMPPHMMSKLMFLGLFVFNTIEDPLVAMLNTNRCIDIGEKICRDAMIFSAEYTQQIMNP
jgi:hypothetical protein